MIETIETKEEILETVKFEDVLDLRARVWEDTDNLRAKLIIFCEDRGLKNLGFEGKEFKAPKEAIRALNLTQLLRLVNHIESFRR